MTPEIPELPLGGESLSGRRSEGMEARSTSPRGETAALSLADLLEASCAYRAPISPETALYLALEVWEIGQRRGLSGVTASSVFIDGLGGVHIAASEGSQVRRLDLPETTLRASVLVMLADLLVRAAPPLPEGMLALLDPASAPSSEEALGRALHDALVPLNRPAAARILARLRRQVLQLGAPPAYGVPAVPVEQQALDAELDAWLDTAAWDRKDAVSVEQSRSSVGFADTPARDVSVPTGDDGGLPADAGRRASVAQGMPSTFLPLCDTPSRREPSQSFAAESVTDLHESSESAPLGAQPKLDRSPVVARTRHVSARQTIGWFAVAGVGIILMGLAYALVRFWSRTQ